MYPDSGVAALLKNTWKDFPYSLSSLTDRKPVAVEDDLVVVAAPDPQGALAACPHVQRGTQETS